MFFVIVKIQNNCKNVDAHLYNFFTAYIGIDQVRDKHAYKCFIVRPKVFSRLEGALKTNLDSCSRAEFV